MRTFEAKRALIHRIQDLTASGDLPGLTAWYADPGPSAGDVYLYGGGTRWTNTDIMTEFPGAYVQQDISIALYLRLVKRPSTSTGIQETDELADLIVSDMSRLMLRNPYLATDMAWQGFASGQGDFESATDEVATIVGLEAKVNARSRAI